MCGEECSGIVLSPEIECFLEVDTPAAVRPYHLVGAPEVHLANSMEEELKVKSFPVHAGAYAIDHAGCAVAYDSAVAGIVGCPGTTIDLAVAIVVHVQNVTRIHSSGTLRFWNAVFQASVSVEVVGGIVAVGGVAPYFADLHAFVIIGEELGFVAEAGDFCFGYHRD